MTGFFSRMFDPPRRPGFFGGDLALGSGSNGDASAGASSADGTAIPTQWGRSFFALDPNDLLFPPSALGSYFGSLTPLNLVGGYRPTMSPSDVAQSGLFPPGPSPLSGSLAPAMMGGGLSAMPLSYGKSSDGNGDGATDDANDEVALSSIGRWLFNRDPANRANALNALHSFLGVLTDQQRNAILDQIINNIGDLDAREIQSIHPQNGRVVLTPDQYGIISSQIEMLSPEYRDKARAAFQKALQSGQVTCPTCR